MQNLISLFLKNRNLLKSRGTVTLVLESGNSKQIIKAKNIITSAGDLFYAQRAAGESPSVAFHMGRIALGTAGTAPGKGSQYGAITNLVSGSLKAFDGGYPKSDDDDADNSGAGINVVSYRVSFGTGEANAVNIDRIAITIVTPAADSPLLMYATVIPFTKTSSDTLKVYVNHAFLGV